MWIEIVDFFFFFFFNFSFSFRTRSSQFYDFLNGSQLRRKTNLILFYANSTSIQDVKMQKIEKAVHFPLRFSASSSTKRKGKRLFRSTQIPFLYKILKSKNENIHSRFLNISQSPPALFTTILSFFQQKIKDYFVLCKFDFYTSY